MAALEALLALRSLAGDLVDLEIVAATPDFVYRPLAVAEPFGLGTAHRFDLSHIARDQGAALHVAGVDRVEPERASPDHVGRAPASTTTCSWWRSGLAPPPRSPAA